nr:PREDICTED: putative cysteine proteinase CG12163 [Bemisia tabaci]
MSGIAIFLLVELLALIGVHEIGCDVKFKNQDAVLEDFEITKSEKVHYGSLDEQAVRNLFDNFIREHNKEYKSHEEKERRLKLFVQNLKKYDILNEADMGTAVYGVDEFSDMSEEEFKEKMLLKTKYTRKAEADGAHALNIENLKIPQNFDWRTKGAVSPVKSQGYHCGSCWAFATVAVLESLYYLKHKKMEIFSEQQLVDCDPESYGCAGGLMSDAVNYIKSAGGLELNETYPYKAQTEPCHHNLTNFVLKVKNLVPLPRNAERKVARWLFKNGPVKVAVDSSAMYGYIDGIAHPPESMCSKIEADLNHEITLVGYGVQVERANGRKKKIPYWIAKNSWGEKWGAKGYYYLYRGDSSCGVAVDPHSAEIE